MEESEMQQSSSYFVVFFSLKQKEIDWATM